MKKIIATLVSAILVVALIAACQPSKDKAEQTETGVGDSTFEKQSANVMYTCTMHPEVMKAEPGKCPKCDMELVKKEMTHEEMENMDSTKHE